MIKTKTRTDGLIYTYSDVDKKIQKVGTDEIYDTAVDLPNAGYTYAEIDEPQTDEATPEQLEAALHQIGGAVDENQ